MSNRNADFAGSRGDAVVFLSLRGLLSSYSFPYCVRTFAETVEKGFHTIGDAGRDKTLVLPTKAQLVSCEMRAVQISLPLCQQTLVS